MKQKDILLPIFEKYNTLICQNADSFYQTDTQISKKAEQKIQKHFKKPDRALFFNPVLITCLSALAACVIFIATIATPSALLHSYYMDTVKSQFPDGDALVVYTHIGTTVSRCTDIFSAKVLSKKEAPDNLFFYPSGFGNQCVPVIYTVEVTKTFRSLSLEKGMVINVVRKEVPYTNKKSHYTNPLETGKNYFFTGDVDIMNNKPVIIDYCEITGEIAEDNNTLTPMSTYAKDYMDDLPSPTIENYFNNKLVKEALSSQIRIPYIFEVYKQCSLLVDDSDVSDAIKKAIPVQSNETIVVTPEQINNYSNNSGSYDKQTDAFIGTVISQRELSPKETQFGSYEYYHKPIMYTIKVKKVYSSLYIEKDMTINVIRLCRDLDTQGNYSLTLKNGSDYIVLGELILLNGKPTIVDDSKHTFGVDANGKPFSISAYTDGVYQEDIDADTFFDQKLERYVDSQFDNLFLFRNEFVKKYGSPEAVIEAIKEALPTDSDKKVAIKDLYKRHILIPEKSE